MIRQKMASESKEHYMINENFANLSTINLNGKVHNVKNVFLETRVGSYIPDVKVDLTTGEILYIEVICTHSTEVRKIDFFTNQNFTLLSLDLSSYYKKYKDIYSDSDWYNVINEIFTGKKNNNLLTLHCLKNRHISVNLDNRKVQLVSYIICNVEEDITIVDATDDNGNVYKFYLDNSVEKKINAKKIKSFSKNKPIYYVKAYYGSWIKDLYNATNIRKY